MQTPLNVLGRPVGPKARIAVDVESQVALAKTPLFERRPVNRRHRCQQEAGRRVFSERYGRNRMWGLWLRINWRRRLLFEECQQGVVN